MKLINEDCITALKKLEDNSVDSIVTDPPYELGFMGKSWDSTGIANNVEMWKECLRVLKPGGHLLAFSGTRTYHRMASAIEDAGFEVRDMIEWVYGCLSEDTEILTKDGFKLFHKTIDKKQDNLYTEGEDILIYDVKNNLYKWEKPQRWSKYFVKQDTAFRIKSDTTDQIVSRNHNCLVEREGKLVFIKAEELLQVERVPVLSDNFYFLSEGEGKLLQSSLLWKDKGLVKKLFKQWERKIKNWKRAIWKQKSSLERGLDLQKEEGQVCRSKDKICEMSSGVSSDGEKGWLCNGTQVKNSTRNTKTSGKDGVCSSHQSQCNGQQDRELDAIQDEQGTQKIRARATYNTTLATVEKIKYSGVIFCPTVSTGAFVARRNGKIFITGNSGFPKSLNIGKKIDQLQGNKRESLGITKGAGAGMSDNLVAINKGLKPEYEATKGTSEWENWGSQLKPAHEPICMARKPLGEKTIAENCLKWRTGGINIFESRVEIEKKEIEISYRHGNEKLRDGFVKTKAPEYNPQLGRFPANLIHDNSEEVRECFPETKSHGGGKATYGGSFGNGKEVTDQTAMEQFAGDSGNASRFFKSILYYPKASKKERDMGCEVLEEKEGIRTNAPRENECVKTPKRTNNHPTVKPIALMEYLIKMVTPKGGTILDPFMGSGSTGVAAKKNGYDFIGIDITPEYVEIAKARINNYEIL